MRTHGGDAHIGLCLVAAPARDSHAQLRTRWCAIAGCQLNHSVRHMGRWLSNRGRYVPSNSSTLAQLPPLWLRGRRRFLTLCKGASGLGSHPVRAHASSSAEGFSPFHSAGGPPVTSILPARPPMRGREKKRHMWPWQTSIHVDAWRKAEPSQDIVSGAKEGRALVGAES